MIPKNKIKFGWLALCAVLVILIGGCSSAKDIEVSAADNGARVELDKGQVLVVLLEGNPTTGYLWAVDALEDSVVALQGEADYVADSSLVGSGGVFTYWFKAMGPGETTLKMVYHKPWEADVDPIEVFELVLVVK